MRHDEINSRMMQRHYSEQVFYGWFDDPTQEEPSYSPPLGGPCLLCGKLMAWNDEVRTHSLMYQGAAYAKRSFFYRTHKICAEKDETHTAADGFILDLIKRNGD